MVSFIFDGEMTLETVGELMRGIDEVVLQFGADQKIIVYMNSEGGELRSAAVLADYLNDRDLDVTFVGVEYLMSAAIIFFIKFNGKKRILPGTWGMIHLSYTQVTTSGIKDSKSMDSFRKKITDEQEEEFLVTLRKIGLEEHLIEDVEKGKDIYIKTETLREILGAEE